MKTKTVILLSSLAFSFFLISACNTESSFDVFKQTYKTGLKSLCGQEEPCTSLIEQHFETCLNEYLAKKMLTAKDESASSLNQQLTEQTMQCLEQFMVSEKTIEK